eukprot:Nitzschia sp. Nitz4//NODE_444_length_18484_cov_71.934560//8151//9143//NITZ4_additional_000058-RA//1//CDS//3329531899//3477//frame0
MATDIATISPATTDGLRKEVDPELGEKTPLIGDSNQDDNEEPLPDLKEYNRRETLVAGFGAVSFVTSAMGMLLNPNIFVYISGTLGLATAPYVAIQQRKITDVKALAVTNQRVEEEVEQLKGENVKLQAQVAQLTESVQNLKIQKEKLDTLQGVQGTSLDKLEKQLEETRKIHQQMKSSVQGEILNNLIEIALVCDADGDMILSDEEIDHIISKMESIHGIDIDNEKIRAMINENGRSLDAVMELVKNLLGRDVSPEEAVFKQVKDA